MASQATSTKGSVLDYSLDVFGFAYDGERVGQAMLKLLPTIQELVSAEELERLTQEANRAAHHDFAQPPPKANRKTHPLRAYVDRAPLYCAFSVDRREEFPEPVPELLALGQALAILEAVSPQVTSAQQRQITTFLHQLPSKSSRRAGVLRPVIPASLDGEEIKRCLDRLPEMVGRGIEEARLKEYKVILDGLYAHVTGERVKRAQPKKRRKFSSKQGRKISRKPLAIDGGHWRAVPAKDPSDDSNKLEPSLATGKDLLPTDTEAKAKTFNLHGHNLRFNRMYAGQSTEAFSPAESALAMKELLVFHPETPGQSAARLIWVLVGMFGRLFDDLGLAIMKPHSISDEDGEILDFRRIGNVFEIDVRHVLASKLPVLPPQILVSACSHTLTLKVRVPDLPDLEVGWQFLRTPSASLVDDRINELLEEKIKIRRWVRKREVSRFTETRLRGGLVQAVFSQDFDLPKTQLMFSEAFESSLAALHYLSWKNSDIQRTLSRANLNLYSASVTDQPEANSRRVGADKSQIDPENFKEASRWFNTSQRRLRKLGAARWRDRHELLVQTTVHALGAGAGHRFTEDLASLTLNDLSLEHGLGLFRDKPADSSAYRRLAVIPSSVIQGLYRYLEHLQFLEKDKEHGVPEKVKNYARCALEGDIPLFWYLAGDERLPPQPRLLFKELLSDDNIEPNCYRHAASTGLRELGASPLLVEMHLGHSIREPLLGKEGLISPKDLATELRPFLDKLFETYGYEIPKYKGAKFVRQPVSREQFHLLNKNEADRDRKLLLGQLKSAISSSPLPKRNQCIDEAIANVVPGFDGKTFPPGTNVGKDETRKIRDNLISVLSGNFLAIYRACKDLRRKLRLIAETSENCSVEILPPISWDVRPPLPITRAHILAADQFAELERQFVSACEKKNTDKALLARTALVLWGNCPTFKEAEQWLIVFERTPVIKGEDFQIIELGNGVSRTISGSAYQICLAWLAAKSPKPAQTLTSIFGKRSVNPTLPVPG